MSSYHIIQTENPEQFRDKIIAFWDEYLPGTPHKRYDWLTRGNPDGPAIWFLALLKDTNELIGTINVLPRTLIYNQLKIKSGILGDFTVHRNHRVFGPGLKLPKQVAQSFSDLGFDVILTIPNEKSKKAIQRAGLKQNILLKCYAKPIQISYYLKNYMPEIFAKVLSPIVELGLTTYFRDFWIPLSYRCDEIFKIDERFDRFWKKALKQPPKVLGNHSAAFLRWKVCNNPLSKYRFLTVKEKKYQEMSGYLVFKVENKKMEISDSVCLDKKGGGILIRSAVNIARKEKCQAIYFTVPEHGRWPSFLKSMGFMDSENNSSLHWLAGNDIDLKEWEFLQGDRNI